MLDDKHLEDLRKVFDTLILFGDPAQLAPVGQSDAMAFDSLPASSIVHLEKVHRQAQGNPIVEIAYALADPALDFEGFERLLHEAAERDDRVVIAPRADAQMMSRSPMLVWRNATRIRLIHAFRTAYGIAETVLEKGEPLICDGAEIPLKHRKKRINLEQAGLVKGAQVFYLGPGRKPGFARLFIAGAEDPQISVASIIQIERGDGQEPIIPLAARMGAVFLHGAACTIHKAQGSQWPNVQVFAPDIYAAARSNRTENGIPLWKRLAYVAITRAQGKVFWVKRYAMGRPVESLSSLDFKA
jgi:exodeoxyribonuclease-5